MNVHIYLELNVLALELVQVMIAHQLPLKVLKIQRKLHNALSLNQMLVVVTHVWQMVARNVKHKHVQIMILLQQIVPIMHQVVCIIILNVLPKIHVLTIQLLELIILLNKHGVKESLIVLEINVHGIQPIQNVKIELVLINHIILMQIVQVI
jgi:hypothetical protein